MQMMALFTLASISTGILCVLLLILLVNLLTFPRLHPGCEDTQGSTIRNLPLVSVLLPARNEERCIAACVRSLVEQRYERLEVLVLDDQSQDGTARIVQEIIDTLPPSPQSRLRLISGATLPDGWVGKNFACQQLAEAARGDFLLFTDADTLHTPGMVEAVITCMQQQCVQLLTAQPEQICRGLGERLVVPLLNFTILTLLPVALIRLRPEPSLSTGNGQLLCFQRSAYQAIGGHASVRGRILEDVLLARATKAAGLRMIFVDALELVRCRMYHSFGEVWRGFSKNMFAFYNYSLPFALFALLLNLLLFVVPPLLALVGIVIKFPMPLLLLEVVAYALAVLMRMLLTLRLVHKQRGYMLLLCLLHPISITLEGLILLNSLRWHYRKQGTPWKGRYYTHSKA